ncbi:hypothetical protein [Streptomyces sp. NPDC000994]
MRSGELALSVAVREYESRMLVDGFASVGTALRYLTLATARSRALRGTARSFFRTCGAIGPLVLISTSSAVPGNRELPAPTEEFIVPVRHVLAP